MSYYITRKASPAFHQMTLEEFLSDSETPVIYKSNKFNTVTAKVDYISNAYTKGYDFFMMNDRLKKFNEQYEYLRVSNMHDLYYSFKIPKKSGGLRKIDAPDVDLMKALRELKSIIEEDFIGTNRNGALYHTTAFAYIKGRSTIDAVKRHQTNKSKWFAKFDLHDFFGSTTMEFFMRQLNIIFPFCEIIRRYGNEEIRKAFELGFLDGGLPQGTPLSPLITNIMMIPIDFELSNALRNFNDTSYVYTRYADDFLISSQYDFDVRYLENLIRKVLNRDFNAPFSLNAKKTRYGSSSGSNWNLGVMLNANNEITVGHKNKKRFQAMLSSYIMDKKAGSGWEKSDIQELAGLISYYRMVEKETIDKIIKHLDNKFNVDSEKMIKSDLKMK